MKAESQKTNTFRPAGIPAWLLVVGIFVVHAIIRFGGLTNSQFIALSMVIVWPLPWLLANRDGRQAMRFKAPVARHWYLTGPLLGMGMLLACAAVAFFVFGENSNNWFVQHAHEMKSVSADIPAEASLMSRFWIVTIPAMIFSPLAEEFLYRGFMLEAFAEKWNERTAMIVQAAAFGLIHLAHYGLNPFQPALIAVWVPSMFLVALGFGWIVKQSGSIWVGVLAHSILNLSMNGATFLLLPNVVG